MIGDCVLKSKVKGTYQSITYWVVNLLNKSKSLIHDDGNHHSTIVNMRNVVSVTIQER